ncbi:MAG: type IV pilus twitching motility protein PilT [Pyrinomonadaceae bacterium]
MSKRIDDLLRMALSFGASDIHLRAGSYPIIRVNGDLRPVTSVERLNQEETLEMAFSMMSNRQKILFKETFEVDIGYGVSGLGRFRVNIFQQRSSVGIVARVISDKISSFSELGLPLPLAEIADEQRGLVLVTGSNGMGKSTTVAAIIDHINSTRAEHIVTIEDPIEVLHKDKKSYVTQREVDVDTRSFSDALRGAVRQDPDVIMVGDFHDPETIETALHAAETGQLIIGTMGTFDATETIAKIINSFPDYQQRTIRIQLAGLLKAIVSQRLLRTPKGGRRTPAVEILRTSEAVRECILYPEKTIHLREALSSTTSTLGTQTFDQSLLYLYQSGLISLDEALRIAGDPDDFRVRLTGIPKDVEDDDREISVEAPETRSEVLLPK